MDGRARERWITLVAIMVIVASGWAFWVLPRQWAGTPVQVDTDYVGSVP